MTLSGVKTDIPVQVTNIAGNKYKCTYIPQIPGEYICTYIPQIPGEYICMYETYI